MPTRDEDAFRLAQAHYTVDSGITKIFRLMNDGHEDQPDEPVKLLEVSEDTLPLGIRPVYFRAQPPFTYYPSAIVEITPEEFDRLRGNDQALCLPAGWKIGELIERRPAPQGAET